MKKILTLLFSLSCAVTVFAAPDAAQIFRSTTRHVDFDGENLLYLNTTELGTLINKLPAGLGKIGSAALGEKKEDVNTFVCGAEILLKTLNLNALQAVAASEKKYKDDLYVSKSVLYLGKDAALPGLFNTSGFSNNCSLNEALAEMPSDVIAAIKFQFYPGTLYAGLEKNIEVMGDAAIKEMYVTVKSELAQKGIDLKQLLNSAGGTWSIIAAGSSEKDLRVSITIPDNDGTLTAVLKKFLPPGANTPDRSFIPGPMSKQKPAVLYLDKKIVLVSDAERCAKIERPFSLPADFVRMLPAKAAGFKVVRLSPELIAGLKQMKEVTKEPVLQQLIAGLKPGLSFEATQIESDAVRNVTVADFSASDFLVGWFSIINGIKR